MQDEILSCENHVTSVFEPWGREMQDISEVEDEVYPFGHGYPGSKVLVLIRAGKQNIITGTVIIAAAAEEQGHIGKV